MTEIQSPDTGAAQTPEATPNQPEIAPKRVKYIIDAAALAAYSNQLEIALELTSAISERGFSLETTCAPCHDWDSGRRRVRPHPPYAIDAAEGCAGCAFSFLIRQYRLGYEERLSRLLLLKTTWEANAAWIKAQGNKARVKARNRELSNIKNQIAEIEKILALRNSHRRGRVSRVEFVGNKPSQSATPPPTPRSLPQRHHVG